MSDKVSVPGASKYLDAKKNSAKDRITNAFSEFKERSLKKDLADACSYKKRSYGQDISYL
jgi:hypothetical protein